MEGAGAVYQVMVSVLWDSEGILLLEFLKRGAMISSEQYMHTLKKLKLKGSATSKMKQVFIAS
jgi:hypothetical protein